MADVPTRVYGDLRRIIGQEKEESTMRIMTLKPEIPWSVAWKNLGRAILPAGIRSMWYMVVHDIFHVNDRLYIIHLSDTDKWCRNGAQNSLLHLLRKCGESSTLWFRS